MAATKLERWAEELVDEVMEGNVGINDAIEQMDRKLEVFDRVKVHRDRLTSARRALLGVGSRTTSSGGARVTVDEVALWLETNGPATNAQMAEGLGVTDGVIRGHMSRNKDRFHKNGDGNWSVVDHEKDDTVDDDEGDDD